jgi:uncharacterized protein YwgA
LGGNTVKRYDLAKLISWAGTLDTRKRLQKVVYLLQSAGCELNAEFYLHRYGPYSTDVASMTDELVGKGVLHEVESRNAVGRQFSYELTDQGRKMLEAFEGEPSGRALSARLASFEDRARNLVGTDLWKLEVASTIAYFHKETNCDWEQARIRACEFKQVDSSSEFAEAVERLARETVG